MPNYVIVVIPPKGRVISLSANEAYEADKLMEYYTELGCLVTLAAKD